MTYKHGIPEHAIESTYKFFHRVWVGKCGGKHGEDEHGYKMSWDSRHEDLKPSKTYGQYYCVYCGNRPMPIQPGHLGYEVSGYMCLCADAQKEVENNQAIAEAEENHYQELQTLKRLAPKPADEVKRRIIEKELKESHHLDRVMKSLGY